MTIFYDTVDDACDKQAKYLKRDLSSDEVRLVEDRLFFEWLQAGRFDDLIDHALEEYVIQDGEAFCASLSEALLKAGDRERFERLFFGLIKSREAAFWRSWPKAQEGQIGAMKESARRLASTLEAMAGLYHCYWKINDEVGKESVKNSMLRLQARQKSVRAKLTGARQA